MHMPAQILSILCAPKYLGCRPALAARLPPASTRLEHPFGGSRTPNIPSKASESRIREYIRRYDNVLVKARRISLPLGHMVRKDRATVSV
ncbi:hypothetical protein DENSPDRAFT_842705 [Dentipellis sp. KUC8613]|nr:hypothetical protein DENSPDRAFT_842705 [Dentipellis sp. KUC8613]